MEIIRNIVFVVSSFLFLILYDWLREWCEYYGRAFQWVGGSLVSFDSVLFNLSAVSDAFRKQLLIFWTETYYFMEHALLGEERTWPKRFAFVGLNTLRRSKSGLFFIFLIKKPRKTTCRNTLYAYTSWVFFNYSSHKN